MSVITKTQDIVLLSHQLITHPASVVGSAIDVGDDLAAWIFIDHAYVETTANAIPAEFHILGTPFASGDEGWKTLVQFDTSTTLAETEALTATEPIAETVLAVASTSNLSVGQEIYVQDASVVADGEWHKIENIVSDTSVDLVHGLTVAKDSSDFIFNQAERFDAYLDLTALARIKVYYVNRAATGSNSHIRATMVRADSIG